jgi:hypothetical protein
MTIELKPLAQQVVVLTEPRPASASPRRTQQQPAVQAGEFQRRSTGTAART